MFVAVVIYALTTHFFVDATPAAVGHMSDPICLIACHKLPPGESVEVVAEGRIFAVFNVDGTFHVLDGICSHAGGPLGKGALEGNVITCPWHGWQYDVSSGEHCLNASVCQTTLRCRDHRQHRLCSAAVSIGRSMSVVGHCAILHWIGGAIHDNETVIFRPMLSHPNLASQFYAVIARIR